MKYLKLERKYRINKQKAKDLCEYFPFYSCRRRINLVVS